MKRQISAAEAKSHFGDYLRDAEGGAVVVITRYGKAVAALVSAEDALQVERLRASRPEDGLLGLVGRYSDGEDLAAALDEIEAKRGPERSPPKLDG